MDFLSIFGVFLVRFGRFLSFLTFFWGVGGPERSKMVRGTRTIILVPLIPHIDHSRPRSTPFWVSQAKLLGAFGAWGETFQENRPWDLGHGLEL